MAEQLYVSGARGESFADVARRIGTIGDIPISPDSSDEEVLDRLADAQEAVVAPYAAAAAAAAALSTAEREAIEAAIAGYPNGASLTIPVATRLVLAAVASPAGAAFLYEAGRQGVFVWSSADNSANVTGDPSQGIYVAPASDPDGSSGAWVRVVTGPLPPQWFGAGGAGVTDDTAAVQAALDAAPLHGGHVVLSTGTYLFSSQLVMPQGVVMSGPASAVLKRINQVSTVITSAVPSGTGEVSFTVTSAAGLAPGQGVAWFNGTTPYHQDPYAHRNRTIKTIVGLTVTLTAGTPSAAVPSGATMFTTSPGIIQTGDNICTGFTIDGNEAQNLYGHWRNSTLIIQEGDNCIRHKLRIINTTADAVLVGGPLAGEIVGSWDLDSHFENIGGNGIHYGNVQKMVVKDNIMIDGNMRLNEIEPEGGGGGGGVRGGHQDGAIIYSQGIYSLKIEGNEIDNWITGVHLGNATSADLGGVQNINDEVTITGNVFRACYSAWEINYGSIDVIIKGNRVFGTFPLSGSASVRWADSVASVVGSYVDTDPDGGKMVRRCVVQGNTSKNQRLYFDRVEGAVISSNVVDMVDTTATASTGAVGSCLSVLSSRNCTIIGNTLEGGAHNLWMQNTYDLAHLLGRANVVGLNTLVNARVSGVAGSLGGTGLMQSDIIFNTIVGDSAAGTAAAWYGVAILEGMRVAGNRLFYDGGTRTAWASFSHAATKANRKDNFINGAYELLDNYANDAAAATGNVPVGGWYRNGSIQMQRVA